ncbi:hypothetical protein OZ401_002988 [Candidatus Chlorohelix allophototropha]|uniref:DUF697 domain-containing protein n=1 Tax=Candidatus Chlorohelix allophototropha TaxID=3003348 RepID=A0ABY9B843_9CHLR|nr:hypothetical protein OZ401_002988 [Chloroflexota bacterium L227-S17]
MGILQDLFELLRDNSSLQVEEEAGRDVIIALAGNSGEVRDRLQRALSSRLESLWTTSPFRVVETNENPGLDKENSEGGLLLYVLYAGDRIPEAKKLWLEGVVANTSVAGLVVVIPPVRDDSFDRNRKSRFNLLRLIGNNGENSAEKGSENEPADWESELERFTQNNDRLGMVKLTSLEFEDLQKQLLPAIVQRLPDRLLALAKRAPLFRNSVADYFISRAARENAELVLLSNATSFIPILSDLFGGGADFVLLSKNQFELSNRLAALYGQNRSSRFEIWLEVSPIIASALVWRSISQVLTAKLPRLLHILPKAGIAYTATYAVGQAARYYYAGGRTAPAQLSMLLSAAFARFRERFQPNGDSKHDGSEPPRQLRRL